jgi:hypothetical protein
MHVTLARGSDNLFSTAEAAATGVGRAQQALQCPAMAASKKKKPAPKKPAAKKPAPKTAAAPTKAPKVSGDGTAAKPWKLTTPPGSSAFIAYKDGDLLVCKVGSTTLSYQARCLDDLHAMLKAHGDWMALGGADEGKPAAPGTVEAWGRDASNPVGGWYGTKKGFRGRFGVYVPPVMEALGLAELEHLPKNNRMRAK